MARITKLSILPNPPFYRGVDQAHSTKNGMLVEGVGDEVVERTSTIVDSFLPMGIPVGRA